MRLSVSLYVESEMKTSSWGQLAGYPYLSISPSGPLEEELEIDLSVFSRFQSSIDF
jgi:hypothetical protein